MAVTENLGAIGSAAAFPGFEPADFDAFEPKKWSSNAYTLERRRAKDRLLALVRAVGDDLATDLDGLELGASEEAPSVANGRKVRAQWVFFTRNTEDRAGLKTLLQRTDLASGASLFDIAVQHQHASLLFRVDHQGFAAGVELATKARVDRDNTIEKLKQRWGRERLAELAKALPEGARIGFEGSLIQTRELSLPEIEPWTDRLRSEEAFVAEIGVGRSEALVASPALIPSAVTYAAALLPILRFLAWTRDNDRTQVKDAIQKEMKVREKRATFEPGDRVTILSGLFAGRGGYVAEVGKGKAKVMVGPVSVSVDVKDLKGS